MIDKKAIANDLTEAFIKYQYRLDNPMPKPSETIGLMVDVYRNDRIFNCKVKSLVCGVMSILDKHV